MDELNERFKKSAEEFVLMPSAGLWGRVEAGVAAQKRRKLLLFFLFSVIAVMAVVFFLLRGNGATPSTPSMAATENKSAEKKISPAPKHPAAHENAEAEYHPSVKNNSATENNSVTANYPATANSSAGKNISAEQGNDKTEISSPAEKSSVKKQWKKKQTAVSLSLTAIPEASFSPNEKHEQVLSGLLPGETKELIPATTEKSVSENQTLSATTDSQDSLQTGKADSIKTRLPDTTKVLMNDSSIETNLKSRWSISAGFAPALTRSHFEEKGDYRVIANYRDSSDRNRLTYNYHFSVMFAVHPQLEIFTGAGILQTKTELVNRQAVYKYDTVSNSGPSPTINITRGYTNLTPDNSSALLNKRTWLEIPLGVRYHIIPSRKFGLALIPAASLSRLIRAEGYNYNFATDKYEAAKKSDFRPWLFSYGGGISFQYFLTNRWAAELMPYYRNIPGSVYRDSYPLREKISQSEIRISVRYIYR